MAKAPTLAQSNRYLALITEWNRLNEQLSAARAAEHQAMLRRNALEIQMASHHDAIEKVEGELETAHRTQWWDALYGPKRYG